MSLIYASSQAYIGWYFAFLVFVQVTIHHRIVLGLVPCEQGLEEAFTYARILINPFPALLFIEQAH